MSVSRTDPPAGRAEIHQHSGWLIPLGILLVILALCGLFLLYYLRPVPAPFRNTAPSAAATPIALSVRGKTFHIPARYIEMRAARAGDHDVVALFALLPDMRGFARDDAALFAGNAADSPVVHMLIRGDTNGLDSASRLKRIYMPYVTNPSGSAGPFGLMRYRFRADSGYGHDDLFVGPSASGAALLLCEQPAQDLPSPNCLAIDRTIAPGVNLSWRFKRAQLAHWRDIDSNVIRLVAGFSH